MSSASALHTVHASASASASHTVHIKNMAGDMIQMNGCTLSEIAQQLSLMDSEMYPENRTQLLRMSEEEKGDGLTEGEILYVMVQDAYRKETGRWPVGGQEYTRFVIPFMGNTLYLYVDCRGMLSTPRRIPHYGITFSPEITKPSETYQVQGTCLSHALSRLVPITPKQMKDIYDIVLPYYEELGKERNTEYRHTYDPKEIIACECGSVIQRSGVLSHKSTMKHKAFLKGK